MKEIVILLILFLFSRTTKNKKVYVYAKSDFTILSKNWKRGEKIGVLVEETETGVIVSVNGVLVELSYDKVYL